MRSEETAKQIEGLALDFTALNTLFQRLETFGAVPVKPTAEGKDNLFAPF